MTGLPGDDGRAAIDAALAAPLRAAHALGGQRGRLRLVGELATVEAPECWSPGAAGYRHPVVDLDVERREALARFAAARGRRP